MTNEHWNQTYIAKSPEDRSWTQSIPTESLQLISESDVSLTDPIIDVGGGASLLVDELINNGYRDITLLDISSVALSATESRLGGSVHYIHADITTWIPKRTFSVWHDRAVFHFLTSNEDQDSYLRAMLAATATGSHIFIATFSTAGPDTCSGLPVQRWSQDALADFFSDECAVVETFESIHTTPWGSSQPFSWLHARRK